MCRQRKKMGGAVALAPPMLIPPVGKEYKKDPSRQPAEDYPIPRSRIPGLIRTKTFIGRAVGTLDDTPDHHGQRNDGHRQRYRKMRTGCRLLQSANYLNHSPSWHAPQNHARLADRSKSRAAV